VIKDFAGLYALAHEYHEWLQSDEYLPPDRDLMGLVEQESHLVAKLRRFDNYRRSFYHRNPGPIAMAREEDRWFTDYQCEQAFGSAEKRQAIKAEYAERRDSGKRSAHLSVKGFVKWACQTNH
jgi:hypothetical protein